MAGRTSVLRAARNVATGLAGGAAAGAVGVAAYRAVTGGATATTPPAATAKPEVPATVAPTEPAPVATKLTDGDLAANIKKILAGPVLENPLNSVRQANYHFRLFLTQDIDPYITGASSASSATANQAGSETGKAGGAPKDTSAIYEVISKMPQVTLAETGVTTYNIKSVEFQSFVGPNSASRMLSLGETTIVVTEPMGLGFQESIVAAARKLKIFNYSKHFFYLELRFHGYEEDGTYDENPCSPLGLPTGSTWLWQIAITTIDTHLDAGGGTYTLHAVPYQEATSVSPEVYMVPNTLKVSGGTLGDFTDNLKKTLNESWKKRYANSVVQYDIKWHPFEDPSIQPRNAKEFAFKNIDGARSSVRQLSMDSVNGQQTATMQTGVSIDRMIEACLENNEQAQKLVKSNPAIGVVEAADSNRARTAVVFRVEPDVEMGDFEVYSQQYYRKVTYHIRPFLTQAPIVDKQQPINALSPKVSWDAMKQLLEKGLLKKHYDYLYTGLNTEVLDFDIKFSYAWNAELPRAEGISSNGESVAAAARLPDGAPGSDLQVKAQTLDKKIQQQEVQIAAISAQVQRANAIKKQLEATGVSAEKKAELELTLKYILGSSNNDLTVLQKQQDDLSSLTADDKTERAKLTTSLRGQVEGAATKTFSEVLLESPEALLRGAMDKADPRILPVAFSQNWKDTADKEGTGTTGQYHRDKTIFAAVLGQLYQPEGLIEINMTIRGDPFWLGETNLGRLVRMRGDGPLIDPQANIPENYRGDTCFVLKFRAPERIGDDFQPVFNDSMVFNGVYRTTSVRHSFVDGTFKQTLSAFRLALIDIIKAAGYEPSSQDLAPTVTQTIAQSGGASPASANTAAAGSTTAGNSAAPIGTGAAAGVAATSGLNAYMGRSVGDGECVALVQKTTNVGFTGTWTPGSDVRGNTDLQPGTAIATFDSNGRYTSSKTGTSHAAIYLGQNSEGIQVMDQWSGQAAHTRTIRWDNLSSKAVNNGNNYRVIAKR